MKLTVLSDNQLTVDETEALKGLFEGFINRVDKNKQVRISPEMHIDGSMVRDLIR